MTSKERFRKALKREKPDRLPVANHFVMPYFLNKYMGGMSVERYFEETGVDPILWTIAHKPDRRKGHDYDPLQSAPGFLESNRMVSDDYRITYQSVTLHGQEAVRYTFATPKGSLNMALRSNDITSWVVEPLIKNKQDIDVIAEYLPAPLCDTDVINRQAGEFGDKGIVRGWIACFDVFGQPGTWQDACCLYGVENMIMQAYDDPAWVHAFLSILFERKMSYVQSLKGAHYDIHELGGGDASSTVINPYIFENFVAPYDRRLISKIHEAGHMVSYHTCGGMMAFLDDIVDMEPDAIETLTPRSMGGDADLKEIKRRVGDKVCLIGGFDQFHFLRGCTPEETRKEVRRCFQEAGEGGGYILCTSDNFFDADPELICAYADEARKCLY